MIKIYYMKDEFTRDLSLIPYLRHEDDSPEMHGTIHRGLAENKYELVAEYDGSGLEAAYRSMQNGVDTDSWALVPPPKLKPINGTVDKDGIIYGKRSSMPGDIYVINDSDIFIVAVFGFTKIPLVDLSVVELPDSK